MAAASALPSWLNPYAWRPLASQPAAQPSEEAIRTVARTTARLRGFKVSDEQIADMTKRASQMTDSGLRLSYLSVTLEAIEKRQRGFVDGDGI